MKYWFTADLHLNHGNIIKYCDRPFKNEVDMNNRLIHNINNTCDKEDILIHIGDFATSYSKVNYKELLDRIKCQVILITGNHDRAGIFKINSLDFNIGKKVCQVIHNPNEATHTYNLVGHVHKQWKSKVKNNKYYVNVGCDVWGYKPINIKTIDRKFNKLLQNP